jgi:hypothetical protein
MDAGRTGRRRWTIKNPLSVGWSGFDRVAMMLMMLEEFWWRRRESNPRPEALYDQFYILSSVI